MDFHLPKVTRHLHNKRHVYAWFGTRPAIDTKKFTGAMGVRNTRFSRNRQVEVECLPTFDYDLQIFVESSDSEKIGVDVLNAI